MASQYIIKFKNFRYNFLSEIDVKKYMYFYD